VSSASMTTRVDPDGALVAALRRGDPTAAEDLVAAYGNRAYRLAWRITGSAQDAEEAVQDAFLSVTRKIDTFRGESAFGSWLYRIVANAAYQRCRSLAAAAPMSHWTSCCLCSMSTTATSRRSPTGR